MPRISKETPKAAYGATATKPSATFRERLMDLFAGHEWVRVINIDNEPFTWQYLPSHAEHTEFTPDPMKIMTRDDVEMYGLQPGDSEVLIGENAYVMIEALYKKVISKKVIASSPNMTSAQARNFNWTDGTAQDRIIRLIYLGKEDPRFGSQTSPTDDSIKEDLGIESEPTKRGPGRPKQTS